MSGSDGVLIWRRERDGLGHRWEGSSAAVATLLLGRCCHHSIFSAVSKSSRKTATTTYSQKAVSSGSLSPNHLRRPAPQNRTRVRVSISNRSKELCRIPEPTREHSGDGAVGMSATTAKQFLPCRFLVKHFFRSVILSSICFASMQRVCVVSSTHSDVLNDIFSRSSSRGSARG